MNEQVETLLDKAVQNINIAKTIYYSELIADEAYFNYVGYHLQQAVELSMKYLLEKNGVEYSKTHSIEQLIKLGNESNIDLHITEYIDNKAEMFSSWESQTRYIISYKLEKRKVSQALTEVENYLVRIIDNENSMNEENNQSEGPVLG